MKTSRVTKDYAGRIAVLVNEGQPVLVSELDGVILDLEKRKASLSETIKAQEKRKEVIRARANDQAKKRATETQTAKSEDEQDQSEASTPNAKPVKGAKKKIFFGSKVR